MIRATSVEGLAMEIYSYGTVKDAIKAKLVQDKMETSPPTNSV